MRFQRNHPQSPENDHPDLISRHMKILWISALPSSVQRSALGGKNHGSHVPLSWIPAHFPPPVGVDLHIGVLWPGGTHVKSVEYQGVQFHLVPCPKRGRALLLFSRDTQYFRALFHELKPDIVHGWGTEDSCGLVARRLAPHRHVVGIQGLITAYRHRVRMHPRHRLTALTERWTLKKAAWVVAESDYSLQSAKQFCPQARTQVVEHPLREEFLTVAPSNGTATRVLFVGGIEERKGITDAVSAFAAVAPSDWSLHVVGSGTDKAEAALSKQIRALGLEHRFIHNRSLSAPELAQAMQKSSIFLLPTRIDTGPTALKEALAMGLWPVCYDNSGPGEYIRMFQYGSLASDLDMDALIRELGEAIATQPWCDSLRRAELHAATQQRFSKAQAWSNLMEVYGKIISEGANSA